jgi:hypothetical protein
VKHLSIDWNAHTVPNDTNPFWGAIWVRNIRSKDDLPHILRTAPWLQRLVQDAPDADVRDAAAGALATLRGFARDIVTHGYVLRSKEDGKVFIPKGDLVVLGAYDKVLPGGECDAKLGVALVAQGEALGNDCGNGISADYELIAAAGHYYNASMLRYFHLAALANALVARQDAVAQALLAGYAERVDAIATDPQRARVPEWDANRASLLVCAAATGLPLTGDEAAFVQAQYAAGADFYRAWPLWDLWSGAVADGTYPYVPGHAGADGEHPEIEEMTDLLEYCGSPFRNAAGAAFVDCDVVREPARWGG